MNSGKTSSWRVGLVLVLGVFLVNGCVHKPLRSQASVIAPILLAMGDNAQLPVPSAAQELKYMFSAPNNLFVRAELSRIDPGIVFVDRRAGYHLRREQTILCLGSMQRPGIQKILQNLAQLPYIKAIELAPAGY